MKITRETRIEDIPKSELSDQLRKKMIVDYITTVDALVNYSKADLRKANFTPQAIAKIEVFLFRYNLALSEIDQTTLPPQTFPTPRHPGRKPGIRTGSEDGQERRAAGLTFKK